MFFSIIVPVYNVEKYLNQCVDSILGQSFQDFELILVDDGSKDCSPYICDEYAEKDSRVKVIHKKNGGLSDARNVGTEQSVGKYIIYIDSDDYLSSNTVLTKIYTKANEEEPDIICYKFKKYFEDKREFAECTFACADIDKYFTLAERINYMVSCDAFYCSAWSKAFKAELVKKNHIQFEKGLLGEDQEWYYHLLYHISSITFIDEVFLIYRQRSGSITSSWKMKNLTDCIYIIEKWSSKIMDSHLEKEYKRALLNSVAKLYCNLIIAYVRFGDVQKKQYFGRIEKLKFLLDYHNNPRVKKFNNIYRIFKFNGLVLAIKLLCKLR